MEKRKIYFRADGNHQIGLGHLSRCSAMAEMLNDIFECVIVLRKPTSEVKLEMLKNFSDVIEISNSKDISAEAKIFSEMIGEKDIVVLDGYEFTATYQKIIKEKGCLLVCVDDLYAGHFVADAVINHAGGISAENYSREFYTQLYLGPEYALLRKPFYPQNIQKRKKRNEKNILIVMGGADPRNETKKILTQCIDTKPGKHYHIIIGAAYSHMNDLEKFLETNKNYKIKVYKNISAEEIATLMESCPVAITAPSTVAMEYLYVGGHLFLQKIADNQKDIYKYLVENKLAYPIADFLKNDSGHYPDEEIKLKYNFVENIKKIFSVFLLESNLKIVRATSADVEQIFEWINDPVVRRQSFSSAPITWETHTAWFKKKINDSRCFMYLFYLNEKPVAQIRFDTEGTNATISYLIDKEQRGKGFGSVILKRGIIALKKENKAIHIITGFVKRDNIPSCKSFLKMGFVQEKSRQYPDSFKYELKL